MSACSPVYWNQMELHWGSSKSQQQQNEDQLPHFISGPSTQNNKAANWWKGPTFRRRCKGSTFSSDSPYEPSVEITVACLMHVK